MPSYAPGELSADSELELSQARDNLRAQIASLQNPTSEFKAQRLEEIKAELKQQLVVAASESGFSSVASSMAGIKHRQIG
jgi:hypothetical protein